MPDEHIRPIIKGLPVWNKQINELIMHMKYYQDNEDFHSHSRNPERIKKKEPSTNKKKPERS
jgi:hypothetical protein